MSDTYTRLYVHIVFAVKGRGSLISKEWKEELYKYITGVVTNHKQKLIAINGMPDHIHLLIGFRPTIAIADLVRDVKANSSRFINEKSWVRGVFEWQVGYGAFSYSHSQLGNVINYIRNQEVHHRVKQFREEYKELLQEFEIEYKEEHLFEDVL